MWPCTCLSAPPWAKRPGRKPTKSSGTILDSRRLARRANYTEVARNLDSEKQGIEDRRHDLRDGLLDHPIRHGRYSQHPFATPRLRDAHPSDRLGTIAAFVQSLADGRPVQPCKLGEFLTALSRPRRAHLCWLSPASMLVAGSLTAGTRAIRSSRKAYLRDATPVAGSPVRVPRRRRVNHGSALSSYVRPLTVHSFLNLPLVWPLLTSAQSRPTLPPHALSGSLAQPQRP